LIGKLKAGETILIHTATGAVGLAAIQIAQSIGANVIATAGRKAKRTYLKSQGVDHVFSSQNLDFEKGVLEATGGKGVDMILNTLTGPGFKEASLACCAKNARFIEIRKMNIFSPQEVNIKRPDVEYFLVDLLEFWVEDPNLFPDLGRPLEEIVMKENSSFKPLPVVQFSAEDVRSAFHYFEKAKHIGKVVLKMPSCGGMFDSNRTYLITGGCGGIGFEVCKWMCENGALNIVLMGRNPPKEKVQTQINALNNSGKIFH
jgi:NADPH:quinone reductase-like Zn-dependent oxidoreductase